jgi:hypothetical protein
MDDTHMAATLNFEAELPFSIYHEIFVMMIWKENHILSMYFLFVVC